MFLHYWLDMIILTPFNLQNAKIFDAVNILLTAFIKRVHKAKQI